MFNDRQQFTQCCQIMELIWTTECLSAKRTNKKTSCTILQKIYTNTTFTELNISLTIVYCISLKLALSLLKALGHFMVHFCGHWLSLSFVAGRRVIRAHGSTKRYHIDKRLLQKPSEYVYKRSSLSNEISNRNDLKPSICSKRSTFNPTESFGIYFLLRSPFDFG